MLQIMKLILIEQQYQELLLQHDKTRDGRGRDQIKSVIHASNGWSMKLLMHCLFMKQRFVDT